MILRILSESGIDKIESVDDESSSVTHRQCYLQRIEQHSTFKLKNETYPLERAMRANEFFFMGMCVCALMMVHPNALMILAKCIVQHTVEAVHHRHICHQQRTGEAVCNALVRHFDSDQLLLVLKETLSAEESYQAEKNSKQI